MLELEKLLGGMLVNSGSITREDIFRGEEIAPETLVSMDVRESLITARLMPLDRISLRESTGAVFCCDHATSRRQEI